jgi:hypothetical protein
MKNLREITRHFIFESKALTIVELLVAMSLLLIILTIAFSFFGYGVSAFNTGEKRTLVQTNTRLASRIIKDELRYAESVVIRSTLPDHVNGVKTIYLNDNGTIMLRDETGVERKISGDFSDEVTFTGLSFDINTDSYKTVSFLITAERAGEQEYSLLSEVAPLNQKGRISYALEGQAGNVITYILTPPEEEVILNAYPRQVFEQTGSVSFNLLLVGDSYDNLSISDVSLGGDFDSSLYISAFEVIDDQEVNLTLDGNFTEGIGLITIEGSALVQGSSVSVEIFVIPDYVFIEDEDLPGGMVDMNYYHKLTAVGGLGPYTFSFDQTEYIKPSWLNLDQSGILQGTPDTDAVITVKIAVSDSSVPSQSDAREFTFTIDPKSYNLSMFATVGGTTDPPVGNSLYDPGEIVTITATPDPGFVFVNWAGNVANQMDNPTTVSMNEDLLVTANFASTLKRLKDVEGGFFISDGLGNLYIKLNGEDDRVLSFYAGESAGLFSSFDSSLMPGKEEIDDQLGAFPNWTNQIRKEPDGKEYWTRTQDGNNKNKVFAVTGNGIISSYNTNNDTAYLRQVVVLTGAFVDETGRDGSFENPYLIVDP